MVYFQTLGTQHKTQGCSLRVIHYLPQTPGADSGFPEWFHDGQNVYGQHELPQGFVLWHVDYAAVG
jgi:hypothetical protein